MLNEIPIHEEKIIQKNIDDIKISEINEYSSLNKDNLTLPTTRNAS